ncbi:MAG: putative ABC transporter ATP-binding protein YknY [Alphaproteobacteria bacterium MarineAlpha2_Bin1]|nr:MAG: putative ABC transporter ATP-binding protein YknY [Alphaproteobacteria bacterium MarineAlpha2_Bin1]|tara:strand:+ start:919 stop:1602 length:684 start_codon:yes stop_codon:yes gene_type:complete
MELIKLSNLSKTYQIGQNEVEALKNVDLKIQDGEFVAIMGPSGSGKSTLMNLLGCLDKPSKGEYVLDQNIISELDSNKLAEIRNKKIGFVFQNFNLLARTTAIENVEIPLIYSGLNFKERELKAKKKLDLVGLKDRIDHKPNQLSGGQQQRVAIARALVNEPVVVLADEPTGALDSKTGEEIMSIFQRLNKSGITIILVTHEIDVASHAKRVITFKDGVIIEDKKKN